jgi:hypothetical protein
MFAQVTQEGAAAKKQRQETDNGYSHGLYVSDEETETGWKNARSVFHER